MNKYTLNYHLSNKCTFWAALLAKTLKQSFYTICQPSKHDGSTLRYRHTQFSLSNFRLHGRADRCWMTTLKRWTMCCKGFEKKCYDPIHSSKWLIKPTNNYYDKYFHFVYAVWIKSVKTQMGNLIFQRVKSRCLKKSKGSIYSCFFNFNLIVVTV